LWTAAAAGVVYVVGWFIPIMDVDAAQYAAITWEMLERGEFLTVMERGLDYLDKPPLIFWTSALSMSAFGANQFAYRVPALLATWLALYSTYRLGALYDSRRTGYLAAAILATTQAVFLINHDVRTDTNLMAAYIFTVWQLAEYLETRKVANFIGGFVGVGLAMLAKGPIGAVAPAMAFGGHLLLKKKWSDIFHPRWILGVVVVAVILFPMCYGLYTQFDLHPEKVVNGITGVSGLKFFFWTQSFGRITGDSPWANDAGPFFLSHTTLWAFAPWSVLLVMGLWREVRSAVNHLLGKEEKREFILLVGFLLPFMALSMSRYQLPHYAFIVYPLGAILTARYVMAAFGGEEQKATRAVFLIHTVLIALTIAFVAFITVFAFPDTLMFTSVVFLAGMAIYVLLYRKPFLVHRVVLMTITAALTINLMMNALFYPHLLRYQAGSEGAYAANASGVTPGNLYSYKVGVQHSLIFYARTQVPIVQTLDGLTDRQGVWLYLREADLGEVRAARPDLQVVKSWDTFHVTELTFPFLNPATRSQTVDRKCLVKW
jgi:4-amino-4-deoxy-L-arabinose transferase-like glycosyltransferase